jgi:hypothetical protein
MTPVAMKMPLLIFFLLFGFSSFSFAQKGNLTLVPKWLDKKLPTQPKTDFRSHFFPGSADTLRLDSVEVHFPEMFPLNRELNLSPLNPLQQHVVSLPFFELPPAQSRMPLIPFDESVNYTILKKEY